MKKQYSKDKRNRKYFKTYELDRFILGQIAENSNYLKTVQWNARNKIDDFNNLSSKVKIQNRCIQTVNKKVFHKFTRFSRTVFFKIAKLGLISCLRKSSW